MESQNNFETIADGAEEKLGRVSGALEEVMNGLSVEEYEKIAEEFVEKKAVDIIDKLNKKTDDWNNVKQIEEGLNFLIQNKLKNFPKSLASRLVRKISLLWEGDFSGLPLFDGIIYSMLLLYGSGLDEKEPGKENKTGSGLADDVVSYSFSESDFKRPLSYFGTLLPENVIIRFDGNLGDGVGNHLNGGTLIVNGNVGGYCGNEMKKGTIVVTGNAEHIIGTDMEGGTLCIEGNVLSFHSSTFHENTNKGMIIWKGVTIWDKGWTPMGLEMKNKKEIPGIRV